MSFKYYSDNWKKCNDFIKNDAPEYMRRCTIYLIDSLQKSADRKANEIKFLYNFIDKYMSYLPEDAQEELINHCRKEKLLEDFRRTCDV